VVPLLYSRVALGLPFTGWGVYAEGNYLAVGSNSLSDYQVAVTYSFIESLALDLTLQVGYRDFSVDIEDVDDTFSDIGFDGVFAGVELHF
jgi:outer membrane protein